MKEKIISESLIAWFKVNKRDLPWRNTTNPYKIWLSEIILQQTRVAQGLPYYEKFCANFETVFDLADATEEQVLKNWEGLGYYSRARNLHFTAKHIVRNLSGKFPVTFKELLQLKGVGNYTAAAIASFAYDEKVAVLDGNVMRVLSRLYNFDEDIADIKSQKKLQNLANSIIPEQTPGLYNQSIMEFGALYCTPQNPKCVKCDLAHICEGFSNKKQHVLPYKSKKIKIKNRYFNYLVLTNEHDEIYLKSRVKGDIWEGLYDFLLVETQDVCEDFSEISSKIGFQVVFESVEYEVTHVLTHQRIFAKFWKAEVNSNEINTLQLQKFSLEEAQKLPRPILIKNYFDKRILM